jgi:hypothetical protein
METTTKTCHQCGEEVKKVAKKCPFCQSWQKGVSIFANQQTAIVLVSFIPMVIFLVWMTFFSGNLYGRNRANFDQHKHLVVVQESKTNFKKEGDQDFVYTIGTIKNNSDKSWGDVYIEVQYFNEAGTLIDTQSDMDYGLVLSPNSETAFRVRQETARDSAEYKTHKVIVKRAEDAKKWW